MHWQNLVLAVAAISLALFAVLIWFQMAGVYRFDSKRVTPETQGMPFELAEFASADGETVRAWIVLPAGDAPVILAFAGNFSSTAAYASRLLPFVERGYGVALLDYRGSGAAPGTPSETAFSFDAVGLYDNLDSLFGQVIPLDRRILHGFSLGSGVATELAVQRPAAALVLESPFASLTDFFTQKYRGLPMGYLMWRERYDNAEKIGDIDMPILLLRGGQDKAIPSRSFERLAAAAGPQAEVWRLEGAGHANLAEFGSVELMRDFYRRVVSGAP